MPSGESNPKAKRILIICPTWVGDIVMATPTIRAIRQLYPDAHITAIGRPMTRPILDACPWIDRIVTDRSGGKLSEVDRRNRFLRLGRRLASAKFDIAILLPNSFRAALLARLAGIERRVGYDRDGRGFLLTDRLAPLKNDGEFVTVPTRDYYLDIARHLGANAPDPRMELFIRPEHQRQADRILEQGGYDAASGSPLVLINPGANFGDAKMYFPDRFAAVADRCIKEIGATAAVTGSPKEWRIIEDVIAAAQQPLINLAALGVDLYTLKGIVNRSSLMITNDTGPRHIAAALGTPVVTIFGPTDPAWTTIDFRDERQIIEEVECGPCQKKRCPLAGTADELICMKRIEPERVFQAAVELLNEQANRQTPSSQAAAIAGSRGMDS